MCPTRLDGREVYHDNVGNDYVTPKHLMDEILEKYILFEETWGSFEANNKDNMNHKNRN